AHVSAGGMTGYGRACPAGLNRQWGIADVADCINGARYFAHSRLVDARRTVIVGASAGGFTALCALAHPGSFAAGGSYYGITDLETFAREAPKFQRHYLDQLVGPYPRPWLSTGLGRRFISPIDSLRPSSWLRSERTASCLARRSKAC